MDLQIVIISIITINLLITIVLYFKMGSINTIPEITEDETEYETESEPEKREPDGTEPIVKKTTFAKKISLNDKNEGLEQVEADQLEENEAKVPENTGQKETGKIVFNKRTVPPALKK